MNNEYATTFRIILRRETYRTGYAAKCENGTGYAAKLENDTASAAKLENDTASAAK